MWWPGNGCDGVGGPPWGDGSDRSDGLGRDNWVNGSNRASGYCIKHGIYWRNGRDRSRGTYRHGGECVKYWGNGKFRVNGRNGQFWSNGLDGSNWRYGIYWRYWRFGKYRGNWGYRCHGCGWRNG